MKTAQLLLHCPDKPGILAEVTDFITVNKGNIIYLDQYVDHAENIFFMRLEWELKDFLVPQEKIEDYFATLYAQKYGMSFRLYFSDMKPRMFTGRGPLAWTVGLSMPSSRVRRGEGSVTSSILAVDLSGSFRPPPRSMM